MYHFQYVAKRELEPVKKQLMELYTRHRMKFEIILPFSMNLLGVYKEIW